jgi:hypothetical protein
VTVLSSAIIGEDLASALVPCLVLTSGHLQTQMQNHKAEVNNLSLRDYMIKPIQRICKYPLLFKVLHLLFSTQC